MARFSKRSIRKLKQCHPDLQAVFSKVIEEFDCIILEGHRGELEQNEAYHTGHSMVKWPDSKHNSKPSTAVDVAVYFKDKPHIKWNDLKTASFFAGYVLCIAVGMGINIRWGGDFNQNHDASDQSFFDAFHFELVL